MFSSYFVLILNWLICAIRFNLLCVCVCLCFLLNIVSFIFLLMCSQMPSSKPQSADDIIKKCHDVGGKFMQVGGGGGVDTTSKNATIQQHVTAAGNGAGRPVHYLHELPHAAEERYAELFKQLDRNGEQSNQSCVNRKTIALSFVVSQTHHMNIEQACSLCKCRCVNLN